MGIVEDPVAKPWEDDWRRRGKHPALERNRWRNL